MNEDKITLFLEENGFAKKESYDEYFEKTVIQNGESINLKARFVENLFVLGSGIRCEKTNVSYSSDVGDELRKFSDMDKVINVFTAFPILMKTFYKTEENTMVSIKTHKGQSYHEIYPAKHTEYQYPDRGIRQSYDSYTIPPVSVSYEQGFFMFTIRKSPESICIVSKSERIFIDDLFNNRYKGKTLEHLKWKIIGE